MSLHSGIFDRVRRTWDFLLPSSAHKSAHRVDHMVKLNLPPLMGRRDAAYDCAGVLARSNLFDLGEKERRERYLRIQLLLQTSYEDTGAILRTLASPDTERRERAFHAYLSTLVTITQLLDGTAALEDLLLNVEDSPLREFSVRTSSSEASRATRQLNDAELNMLNHLRNSFERSEPKVNRYREYSGKSFSHSNAERYQKSYNSYRKNYCGDLESPNPSSETKTE